MTQSLSISSFIMLNFLGMRSPHHRRQRQAGLPDEAGYPDQRQGEAAVEEGNHLLPSPQGCKFSLTFSCHADACESRWHIQGERKRKSVRGCIVDGNLSVLSMAIIKKGEAEVMSRWHECSVYFTGSAPKPLACL